MNQERGDAPPGLSGPGNALTQDGSELPPSLQGSSSVPSLNPTSISSTTATVTLTETVAESHDEVLRLTLRPRPNVRWDENVVDNEGLGRKSSKRCCIFHKQREFDESSSDSSDEDSDSSLDDDHADDNGDEEHKPKRSRKKGSGSSVPDYQRFHA